MYPQRSRSTSDDLSAEGPDLGTTLPPLRLDHAQSPNRLDRPPALEPPSGPSDTSAAHWLASSSPAYRHHAAASVPHAPHTAQDHGALAAGLSKWSSEDSILAPSSSGALPSSQSPCGHSQQNSPRFEISPSSSRNIAPEDVEMPLAPLPSQQSTLRASSSAPQPCNIRIRQQPEVARACGFGERDRRVIDPPPILELELSPEELSQGQDEASDAQAPAYIVQANLYSEDGRQDLTTFEPPSKRNTQRVVGMLAAYGTIAFDEHQHRGCFFVFADLSCRTSGRYRLQFRLMKLDLGNIGEGVAVPVLANLMSDVFTAYSPKDFPGMRRSTALTQALKNQGVSVPAKKSKVAAGSSSTTPNGDN